MLDAELVLGAPGADVEIDEVSFRAHPVTILVEGILRRLIEWIRYIMIAQRGRREFVLRRLESRYVKNAGQGGGGQLADRELQQAILGRGAATLAWGSVVHSDGCKTYSNLNSTPMD